MRESPRTVPELLAVRAAEEPARTAIQVPDGSAITFREWGDRADRLAGGLRAARIERGDRIGLIFDERDWPDFAVAYCGAQAAGAVAVPISARTPAAQLRELLADCGATGLLYGPGIDPPDVPVWAEPAGGLDGVPAGRSAAGRQGLDPGHLAQILYTSGTTGRPKGVSATHANLTHGYQPGARRRPLSHSRRLLHAYPIGTNAAQTMLINALVAEPVVVCMARFDAAEFCALIESLRAGTAFVVPAMAIDLIKTGAHRGRDLSSVVLLGSTAAALPPSVAAELSEVFPRASIVNYYSSTEAAPAQTIMIFDPDRPGAVGQAEDADDLMIADDEGRPLPRGETGEVWLRSAATPRAYFGDHAATREVFRDGWVRMGDLGYVDEDDYLYLVDRDSDVIKSGALKVSTLRIEAALYEHPRVKAAAAVGLAHPVMGAMPAAAVVTSEPVTLEELRSFLSERLAPHEIPARLLTVDALPRNDVGKVVKGRLRELFQAETTVATDRERPETPRAPEIEILRACWARALNVRDVPDDADFFALGGDSFSATRLATLARAEFGVEAPVSLAFDLPGLGAQAAWIAAQAPATTTDCLVEPDDVPLSALQEYFLGWIHDTPTPRQVSAVAVGIRIRDQLDIAMLRAAVDEVVARHDALRTVFPGGRATVEQGARAEFRHHTAGGFRLAGREQQAARLARAALEDPYDIESGPLVRVLLITLGRDHHVLVLGVHHLVFDGGSMGVLLRDLGHCYEQLSAGRRPPPWTGLSAAAVSRWARDRWPHAEESYWARALDGAPAALAGAPRRTARHYTGVSLPISVPSEVGKGLRAVATAHGASAFMGLLAAWAGVVGPWAGAPEVVVMSPVPGRTRPEFDDVAGCLVQSLLLRLDLRGDPGYPALLRQAREVTLAAVEHQHYPYARYARRVPHPAWLRFESWDGPAHLPGLDSEPFPLPRELGFDWPLAPGEIDLSVPELALTEQPGGELTGWLVYNRHAYDRGTVEDLAAAFLAHLTRVVADPESVRRS
ncbi:AMP-binding protein [Streptosporangiaceae bacterium NEAU-GS5]|nr:AMP-binding protein [Streptosporangiaceae bacterium NEAU-GS5]